MFRLIKIIFNAFLLVLAIIGFNAIGGQKYVEAVKVSVGNFIQEHALEGAKKNRKLFRSKRRISD